MIKLLSLGLLGTMSLSAFSQTCSVDMVDRYNRVLNTYRAYADQNSCYEGMKACRKAIRLQPELGGVDCIEVRINPRPIPIPVPTPNTRPSEPRLPNDVRNMNEIEQAANHLLEGCYVIPRVQGWANQLYVNNRFTGNYNAGQDDVLLRRKLRDLQRRGLCQLKDSRTLNLMFTPNLVRDFANHQYRDCYVDLGVQGWANQLYVRNQFKGNFDMQSEENKLRAALAELVLSRTCQYDPIY